MGQVNWVYIKGVYGMGQVHWGNRGVFGKRGSNQVKTLM